MTKLKISNSVYLVLFITILTSCCFAQTTSYDDIIGYEDLVVNRKAEMPIECNLFEDWRKGYLVNRKNFRTKEILLNYDHLSEEFYFEIGLKLYAYPKSGVDSIIFTDSGSQVGEKIFKTNLDGEVVMAHQILDGPFPLVRVYKIVVREPNYHPILDVGKNTFRFKKNINHYLLIDNRLIQIPKKVKQLIKNKSIPISVIDFIKIYNKKRLKKKLDYMKFGIALNNQLEKKF